MRKVWNGERDVCGPALMVFNCGLATEVRRLGSPGSLSVAGQSCAGRFQAVTSRARALLTIALL
jgi:hypothetical protein